jgi:DNA-binding LacI/PurR family transcriptional regulator
VAKRAGVSAATVSYVLSGKDELVRRIAPETRDRIGAAVAELGYVRNQNARHLRMQRTRRICLLMPRIGTPFADGIAADVESTVRRRSYSSVLVMGRDFATSRDVVGQVEEGLADGIIAEVEQFTQLEIDRLFTPLLQAGREVLLLHPPEDIAAFSCVRQDRLPAFRSLVRRLVDTGRRRFAYVRHAQSQDAGRSSALNEILASKGLPPARIVTGAERRASAVAIVHALLQEPTRPDAILVQSDSSAVSVIQTLARLGISVPAQIAVVGSGNAEEGALCFPALTTIGPSRPSLEEAIEHLIDRIEKVPGAETRTFTIPWSVIDRESA